MNHISRSTVCLQFCVLQQNRKHPLKRDLQTEVIATVTDVICGIARLRIETAGIHYIVRLSVMPANLM